MQTWADLQSLIAPKTHSRYSLKHARLRHNHHKFRRVATAKLLEQERTGVAGAATSSNQPDL